MYKEKFNGVVGDHLMIAHYVKYDRLEQLINAEFHGSNYTEINLCIDAYSMIKSIYGLETHQFIDELSIASCIINACAHYRNFFWTRYRVTCKIYVVFSRMEESIREARAFCPTYSNIFVTDRNPSMDVLIDRNMSLLEELCQYIPDVKFIKSEYEPGLVFGRIGVTTAAEIPTIIISKDPWNLQIVGQVLNTYVIRPIKRNGEDLSVLISMNNLIEYYEDLRKLKRDENIIDPTIIGPSYISFIIASTSFPERKLGKIHILSCIIKTLTNAIQKMYIPKNLITYDIESFCSGLQSKTQLKSYEINLRMNAMGFNPCMFRYMNSPKVDNLDMINLHDPDAVKQINDKYFTKVPLDLMSL